jgi:DNA mismatch repair protein MutS2
LAPTFHLSIGLPGRSNAFAIAARLGMPAEIIESARGMVDENDLHTEDLLSGISQAYEETVLARDEAESVREQLEEQLADVQARVTYIEDERREIVNMARKQARRELEQFRHEVTKTRAKLQAAALDLEALEQVEDETEALVQQVTPEAPAPQPAPEPRRKGQAIRPGDTVWIDALNTQGQVTALEGDEAEVQAGRVRLRIKVRELVWQAPPVEPEPSDHPQQVLASAPQSPGVQIDLRGQTTEQALPRVDKHLDAAALAGLPWVRVIHGHGTGVLKRAVREMLRSHPLVTSYEPGKPQEGGEGVTVARLVSSK